MKNLILFSLLNAAFSCSQPNTSVNGIWKSHGSGWILHIQDSSSYQLYDITTISCLPRRGAALSELSSSLELSEDTLLLRKGLNTYKFFRVSELPLLCESSDTDATDLLYNFDVFSETVKNHYAFLELNNIDWLKLSEKQRTILETNPTELELYLIIEEALKILKDNHAYLEASSDFYEKFEAELEALEEKETDTLPEYGDFVIANLVTKHFLQEDLTKDSWLIKWGKMTDHIGFVQIKAMWLFADLNMSDSLIDEMGYVDAYVHKFYRMNESDYISMEKEAVRKLMDQVMADIGDMDSIILDVRFNGGGQDAVGHEILSRFNSSDRITFSRKLKNGDEYILAETVHLEPRRGAFNRPVFVLVSPQTGSAAESFSMYAAQVGNIKLIGSRTTGALSTALEKTLPNGWVFSISDEVWLDHDGQSYENVGIPVDIELNYIRERQPLFRYIADHLEEDRLEILKAMRE